MKGIIIIAIAIALLFASVYIRWAGEKKRETKMNKRIDERLSKRAIEYNNKNKI